MVPYHNADGSPNCRFQVECTAACSPSSMQTWLLTMTNETAGWTWTQSFQYQSSMASAEWITEPPHYNGILPLADYGRATYDPVAANGLNPNLSLSANGIIAQDPWGRPRTHRRQQTAIFSARAGAKAR